MNTVRMRMKMKMRRNLISNVHSIDRLRETSSEAVDQAQIIEGEEVLLDVQLVAGIYDSRTNMNIETLKT